MFVMSRSPFAVRLLCRLASLLLVASLLPASAQLRDPVSFPREVIRLPNLRIVGFYNEAGTLLPRNTPTLSGSVVVRVQLPEPLQIERPGGNNPPPAPYAYEYSDITLHFDNEDVNLAGDYILNANGARFVEMELDTTEYANGLHTLAVSDRHGFRDAVTVTITNRASSFFAEPVFDLDLFNGDVPTACQITASLEVAQAWTVEIRSTTDTPTLVRSFSGNSATINLSWDGLDANGNEVEDDTYDVVLTLVNSPGQGSKKQVNKKRGIGDAFILLQKDVFPGPGKQESDRKRNEYKNYILSKLRPLVGSAFYKINVMQISSNEINSARTGPGIFNAINKQLGARLNLLYVCSHGTDAPLPLFGIGRVTWISRIEANDPIRPGTAAVDLRALAAPIGYGNNADPPGLVWIDACDSAGSGGGINNDFGDTFASGQLGYGVFLGWSGQCEQYGSQPPPNDAFDYWRRQLWHELFAAHRNFQTALSRTDTLTSNRGFGQLPPDHRPTVQKRWSGAGTTGF